MNVYIAFSVVVGFYLYYTHGTGDMNFSVEAVGLIHANICSSFLVNILLLTASVAGKEDWIVEQ